MSDEMIGTYAAIEATFMIDVAEHPKENDFKFYAPEDWLWSKKGLLRLWDSAQEALEAEYETLAVELLCLCSIKAVDCRILWPAAFAESKSIEGTDSPRIAHELGQIGPEKTGEPA